LGDGTLLTDEALTAIRESIGSAMGTASCPLQSLGDP
jgi:hypothetical protein